MSKSFVEEKYGYVENVEQEIHFKNIDYRDTTVPLWNYLQNKKKTDEKNNQIIATLSSEQNQINVALCASIIQLGKLMRQENNNIYDKINKLEKQINLIENKLNSL